MRSARRLSGLAIAMSALLAAGCGTGPGRAAAPASGTARTPSATAIVQKLKSALGSATSVHVSGVAARAGQTVRLDMSLTRAGGMSGTINLAGHPVTIRATGGKVYLKLTAGLVRAMHLPASSCVRFCRKYLELPAAAARGLTGNMNWPSVLGSSSLIPSGTADAKVSGPVTVDGQPAWVIRTRDGATGYVAAHGPAYLLRLIPARDKGSGQLSFTQWNSATISPPPPASQVVTLSQLGA